jgi:hypothetical protein
MTCPALKQFLSIHLDNTQGLRVGQHFYNLYVRKGSWPELFYGKDEHTIVLIQKWLEDNQYTEELPNIVT